MTGSPGFGRTNQPGHPDTRAGRVVESVEGQFCESRLGKPAPNPASEVGLSSVPCPDDGGARFAQHRDCSHGVFNVCVRDVAEDAADEQHVSRAEGLERIADGGVTLDNLDRSQALGRRSGAGHTHVLGIELHQRGSHVGAAWMPGEHSQDIATLAGTHADDSDGTRRGAVEQLSKSALDGPETLSQSAAGIVVLVVPGPIVAERHGRPF